MSRRSGYMFIDANWELDFDAMIKAHAEIRDRSSSVEVDDCRKMLLVYVDELGWLVWKIWEVDDVEGKMRRGGGKLVDGGKGGENGEMGRGKEAEELRRKMDAVRVRCPCCQLLSSDIFNFSPRYFLSPLFPTKTFLFKRRLPLELKSPPNLNSHLLSFVFPIKYDQPPISIIIIDTPHS